MLKNEKYHKHEKNIYKGDFKNKKKLRRILYILKTNIHKFEYLDRVFNNK
jgi:hypothetical protein